MILGERHRLEGNKAQQETRGQLNRAWLTLLICSMLLSQAVRAELPSGAIKAALESSLRSETNKARDQYRHPQATLEFFDVQPDMRVVEIWPGSGWYTEILAPYLKEKGLLYAAHFNPDSSSRFYRDSLAAFKDKLASSEAYQNVILTTFNPPEHVEVAPPESVDRVLTFRNVHNWYMRGGGDARVLSAFKAFYRALKPGGVLGVVEHRLAEQRNRSDQEFSGYMHQQYVIDMATKAGFTFLASSEINANPRDTSRHPKGVWTLPPSLRLGNVDREKYLAIGESDRMTLKFQKPR